MDPQDLELKLRTLKPRTNAGKLRPLMPTIEAQLKAGVRVEDILAVLREGGIEMSPGSFRNFVANHRKRSGGPSAASGSYDTNTASPAALRKPSSAHPTTGSVAQHVPPTPQQLHAILHPDPVKQAEEMAEYERIAKQNARAKRLAQKQNAG